MKNDINKNQSSSPQPQTITPSKKKLMLILGIIFMSILGFLIVFKQYRSTDEAVSTKSITRPEIIPGKLITLKRLNEEFFIDYHNMFSLAVRRGFEYPEHITLDWTIRYLKGELEKDRAGTVMIYCIFDNAHNQLIGSLEVREKNDDDPGQFGCWINENFWGGGRIQEATTLISDIYFKTHPADSFIAHVRLWNKRSYKALKKAGFCDVGFFYEHQQPTRYILEMKKK